MAKLKGMDDEKLGEIAGAIAFALITDHPDVPVERLLENWQEIAKTLPTAFAICGAVKASAAQIAAQYKSELRAEL